ncbi:MAG: OadG family protein [Arcobacteraceae bacterium]|nr:OadG family protein [Arcobacteraceae bacterium]
MEVNLVGEALKFMALGMGIVFTFLVIMIFALKAQAAIIAKYFAEEPKSSSTSNEWKPKPTDNKNVIAAITAAILHHNQETNNKG